MNTAALIGRKELNAIMDKLITRWQYYIKHLVRGVLISTCFLKLKLRDLYQNFMEDLIHSPENCFLGENMFEIWSIRMNCYSGACSLASKI